MKKLSKIIYILLSVNVVIAMLTFMVAITYAAATKTDISYYYAYYYLFTLIITSIIFGLSKRFQRTL